MKTISQILSVIVFIFITACKTSNDDPGPSELAINLQNGYWEVDFGQSINVTKFDINSMSSYWIEGTPACITQTSSQSYSLDGNVLTMPSAENPLIIDINEDVLTLTDEIDQFQIEFIRKSNFDYSDC